MAPRASEKNTARSGRASRTAQPGGPRHSVWSALIDPLSPCQPFALDGITPDRFGPDCGFADGGVSLSSARIRKWRTIRRKQTVERTRSGPESRLRRTYCKAKWRGWRRGRRAVWMKRCTIDAGGLGCGRLTKRWERRENMPNGRILPINSVRKSRNRLDSDARLETEIWKDAG